MREIKFRVWDKDSNKIYSQDDFILTFDTVGEDIYLSKNDKIIPLYRYDLMQYTGIYDKNGKEICVGDIVVLSEIIYNNCSKSEIEGANSYIGEIVNHKGLCMCVKYKDKNGDILHRPLYLLEQDITSDDCSLAIIGNIYENEDLLEK